ncbi:MAG: hypothetical protein VKK42_15925 [Lyngbya sp.]|nr:hypothetical protein [Lyngbya sp.]
MRSQRSQRTLDLLPTSIENLRITTDRLKDEILKQHLHWDGESD